MNKYKLRSRMFRVASAAGVDNVDYNIPAGQAIKIINGAGYHNEAANLSGKWTLIVGGTEYTWHPSVTLGQNTPLNFYTGTAAPEALILQYGATIRFTVTGTGAGTVVYMDLFVEIAGGVDTYGDY